MLKRRGRAAIAVNQRFETKAQIEKFKRAASLRRMSLNSFMLEAGERLASEILETRKSPVSVSQDAAQVF